MTPDSVVIILILRFNRSNEQIGGEWHSTNALSLAQDLRVAYWLTGRRLIAFERAVERSGQGEMHPYLQIPVSWAANFKPPKVDWARGLFECGFGSNIRPGHCINLPPADANPVYLDLFIVGKITRLRRYPTWVGEMNHVFRVCLLLLLSACSGEIPPAGELPSIRNADLILLNATIYTVNPDQPWAGAIAIKDGQITYVGDDQGARELIGNHTQTIDLNQRMMLPGFHDIHIHPVESGVLYQQCVLFDIRGVAKLLDQIRACALANPDDEWIVGGGWTLDNFVPTGLPDKKLLDDIVPDRPVSLKSSDGHSLWVNSKALELAGIDATTRDPENGRIDRYPNSDEPSGSLQEDSAIMLIANLEPPLTSEDLISGLKYARDLLHSFGITGIQDALLKLEPGDGYYGLEAYNYLDARNELNLHVVTALFWENAVPLAHQLSKFLNARAQQPVDGHVKATAIKIWQDGVIEAQTAALLAPYSDRDDEFRGDLQNPPDDLNEAVIALDAANFQIHFHAIGDRAIRVSLDALELAQKVNGSRDSRHHLSHIQLFDPADIPRFAELNVVANFQPLWAIQDSYITDLTWPRLGEERSKWLYPIGTMQRTGAKVGFGSDWYVTSANPLDGIEAAVTRLDPNGATDLPLGIGEEITLAEAIENYTINSAYVNFMDDKVGSIEVGKQADLVILNKNLFAIPAHEINQTNVVATLFEGCLVYLSSEGYKLWEDGASMLKKQVCEGSTTAQ